MRSHFVNVNGQRMHVVEYEGNGPPLFAAHGTGLVAQVWGTLVPYLAPYFRVFAVDRRGHGDSDKPECCYELDDGAKDYVGIARHFGWDRVVALGHSSGGTSLAVAESRTPGLFSRLALLDPIIFPRRQAARLLSDTAAADASPMVERTRRRRSSWTSAREMFDSLASKFPFDGWQPEALWDYVRYGAVEQPDGSVTLKCPPELEAKMYAHAGAIDLFEEIERLDIPVLIVRGERTDRFPRANAERAVATLRDGRWVEMPGRTHFLPMEDPAGTAAAIVPFLRGAAVAFK
jgi:pimeloyl-ACP methyl ester carboxylesterase